MDSKTKFFTVILLLLLFAGCASNKTETQVTATTKIQETTTPKIANPASVNCIESNGTLLIRTDSGGGEYGICVFSNGAECEEWAYYKGECIVETEAVLDKEFSLWVGSIGQLKQINLALKVLNLSDNSSMVSIKATRLGKESELRINKDSEASFEGYSIKVASISLKEGVAGNKPTDYRIRLMVSKIDRPVDNSCSADTDCVIKDVGSLCGKYLDCVNKNYNPVPPEINSNICGYPEIDGCRCFGARCVGTLAGKTNIN